MDQRRILVRILVRSGAPGQDGWKVMPLCPKGDAPTLAVGLCTPGQDEEVEALFLNGWGLGQEEPSL